MKKESTYYLLVGAYTRVNQDGISVYRFDVNTGETSFVSKTDHVKDPSYLISSPDNTLVFAVNESGEPGGDHVSAFKFDAHKGTLEFINKVSCYGIHPCHLGFDVSTRKLFVANYTSGSLSEISVDANGKLNPSINVLPYFGTSVHPERQASSHIHAAVFSPGNKYLFVTNLGSDSVSSYTIEDGNMKLIAETLVEAGAGPRHLVFNQEGNLVYLILELNATVSVFKHHKGQLEIIQTVSLVPQNFSGTNSAADIHLSSDEKFLYASNRGTANDIVVFSVDQFSGKLTYVDRTSSLGITPRNFIIDPTDQFLLVANQDSDDIFIFKRNAQTGKLIYTEKKIGIEAPVCLQLIEAI